MGVLRFALAATVVLFHVGGLGLLPGRLAVMGFYVVSGFLICRVLDRDASYAGARGTVVFLANRALRLWPLYAVYSAASFFAFQALGQLPRDAAVPAGDPWWPAPPAALDVVLPLPAFKDRADGLPLLLGGSGVIPQEWSIAVELFFYAVAAVCALVSLRKTLPVVMAASLAYFVYALVVGVDFREAYDNGIYKDALTTVWMFGLGGAAYFLKSASRPAPAGMFAAAVTVATVWLVGISDSRFVGAWLERSDPGWAALLAGFIGAFVVIIAVAVAWSAEREPRWSRTLGDLSYGIYLNHLLTAYLMLYAASLAGFSVFGRIGDVGFGVVAVAMSSAVAFVTLKAVEEPIDRLRQRIKAAMAPPAAPPASLAG